MGRIKSYYFNIDDTRTYDSFGDFLVELNRDMVKEMLENTTDYEYNEVKEAGDYPEGE